MKTPQFLAAGLALAWPFLLASSGFGQGALNPPPGPPAPTMKTLDQLEPRTIVNAANTPGDATATFVISAPGSYYLAGNLTGETGMAGIRITADNVTLDLQGFALVGVAGTKAGMITETVRNFAVRNGSVRSWGRHGIDGTKCANALFHDLRVSDNGTDGPGTGNGIYLGIGCAVKGCVLRSNSGSGIYSTLNFPEGGSIITDCSSALNTGAGFSVEYGANVTNSSAYGNTSVGFSVRYGGTIAGCTATYNGSDGIIVSTNCTVSGCTASYNKSNGIEAFTRNLLMNNNTSENGLNGVNGDGINCYGGSNRIDGNHTSGNNGRGVRSTGGADIIIRNTSLGNSAGAYAPGTSSIGPIGSASTATSPWANF